MARKNEQRSIQCQTRSQAIGQLLRKANEMWRATFESERLTPPGGRPQLKRRIPKPSMSLDS